MLSVSLGHGFTQGDVPEQGTRVLVITDNAKARGDALAKELGAEIREKRGTWYPPYLSYDEAITAAYAEPKGRWWSPTLPTTRGAARRRQHQHHSPPA